MSLEERHRQDRVKAARAWIGARWAEFRAKSRFFQARAAMVAAYVAIVLATVLLAPPDPVPWEVKIGRIPFGIAFKAFIEIKNVDAGDYDALVMEVEGHFIDFDGSQKAGTWKKKLADVHEGDKLQLWPEDFKDTSGRSPANTLVVQALRLLDEDGDVVLRYAAE